MDFRALGSLPSAADTLATLNRPDGLKQQRPAPTRSIDDSLDSPPIKPEDTKNRILANSRTETHKETARLTPELRKILTKSYAPMRAGGVNNGLMVFIRIFAEQPEYKNIWPQFRSIPDSSIISSEQLMKHARVYMAGMGTIIDSMNDGDDTEFRNLIRRMARSHAQNGVAKSHIAIMQPEFLEVLKACGVNVDKTVANAWYVLFDVIGNLLSKM